MFFYLHLLVRHISLLRGHSVLVVIVCSQHERHPGKEVLSSKTGSILERFWCAIFWPNRVTLQVLR